MEVQGVAPDEVLRLRRAAGRMYGISQSGTNLDLMWALSKWRGDPLVLASGPLKGHTCAWWRASQPGPHGGPVHQYALSPG
eukprot:9308146-Pyramimonas_sp.AAC.1